MYYVASGDFDDTVDQSDLRLAQEILNTPEALDIQNRIDIPVTAETIYNFTLYETWYDTGMYNRAGTLSLSPAQGEEFYRSCILPDLQDHTLGRVWLVHDDTYFDTATTLGIQIDLRILEGEDILDWEYYDFQVDVDSERCLEWIRENTDLEPKTLREAHVLDGFRG